MNKRTLLTVLLFISIPFTSDAGLSSTAGKLGAAAVKILNRHAYIFTFPIAPITFDKAKDRQDDFPAFLMSLAAWYVSGRLLKTTTKVIMDDFNISPIQD